MPEPSIMLFIAVGLGAGLLSGIFGIGGGLVIVPFLIYFAGFSQHRATGTSLAVLLPPIGIGAVWEYYRHGNVDIRAATVIAMAVLVGGWAGALLANRISGPYLRLAFSIFVCIMGIYLMYGAFKRLGWV